MTEADFFDGLQQLVEEWHKAAETEPAADDVEFMLFLKRSKTGDLELKLMAANDWVSTLRLDQLGDPETIALNIRSRDTGPGAPVVTRIIKKKE